MGEGTARSAFFRVREEMKFNEFVELRLWALGCATVVLESGDFAVRSSDRGAGTGSPSSRKPST